MSGHLSSEQISTWLTGDQCPEAREHLEDCAGCRAKVARLEATLSQFRSSVRHWGWEQAGRARYRPPAPSPHRLGRWMLITATLLIVATLPLYQNARDRRRAREQAEADTVLLERVDRAVSRTVPRPMEPLIELVRWGADPAKGNEEQ